jgi:hypothetical protein
LDDMSAREQVSGFLAELGARLGVTLGLDDNGVCALEYGEGREAVVEVNDDDLTIYLPLTPVPDTGREALFERALGMNLLGIATRGCALGYDQREGMLVLSHTLPVSALDAQGFQNVLGGILEVAGDLSSELDGQPVLTAEGAAVDADVNEAEDQSSADTPFRGLRV